MAVFGLLFATVNSFALIVVCGLLTTAMSDVFSNDYHVYQAEIFPSDVRATAVGWTYSLSRLSSGALPFIRIPVLDSYGAASMFTVVVAAFAATMALIARMGTAHHRPQPRGDQPPSDPGPSPGLGMSTELDPENRAEPSAQRECAPTESLNSSDTEFCYRVVDIANFGSELA
jgi:hypothetical protein